MEGHVRSNWFIYLVFGVIGLYIAIASGHDLWSASKKAILEQSFSISLSEPNVSTLIVPKDMRRGEMLFYFAGSTPLYSGTITVLKQDGPSRSILGNALLHGAKKSFGIKIPAWLKIFRVEEAGGSLDFWPRGTARSLSPIAIPFSQPIAKGETVIVNIDVRHVLTNANAHDSKNKTNTELVTICLLA
jgi:hypothetical protein